MSVLSFPRIHFAGTCLLHEPTGNKNTDGQIDFTRNVLHRNGERVRIDQDVEEFYDYFARSGERYGVNGLPDADGPFGSSAGRDYIGNSRVLWNARVTSCQTAFGREEQDVLIGCKVDLWGHFHPLIGTTYNQPKVVELDSTSDWTRQIYSGQFTLGRGQSSVQSEYLLNGTLQGCQAARLHKRRHYIDLEPHWNADEIGRADLFQFVIEKAELITLTAAGSPCLQAFAEALESDPSVSGLVVQYVLFNASSPTTINTPTIWSLIGSVGIWRESTEMRSYPAGRVCTPHRSASGEGAGTIVLHASPQGLSLNCAIGLPFHQRGAAPEPDGAHAPGVAAIDSDLFVLAVGSDEPLACIAATTLASAAFLERGGIVDVPYLYENAGLRLEALAARDLVVARRTAAGSYEPLYRERTTVIESDAAAVYLDIPSEADDLYFDVPVTVRSYVRGVPARVEKIETALVANPAFVAHKLLGAASGSAARPDVRFRMRDAGVAFVEQLRFATDDAGRAELVVRGQRSGSARVLFIATDRDRAIHDHLLSLSAFDAYDNNDRLGVYAQLGSFSVKVLPDNWDLQRVPADQVDFAFMYQHIFQFYELIYPFMNREVFSLANGPKCRFHGFLHWIVSDPRLRDKSWYMPPTRELSYAAAMLFHRFAMNSTARGYVPAHKTREAARDDS